MYGSLAARVRVVPSEPPVAEHTDATPARPKGASSGVRRKQCIGGHLLVARHDEAVRLSPQPLAGEQPDRAVGEEGLKPQVGG